METDLKENSNVPQFPQKLPGSFWAMTTFFNPVKYKNKLENYKKFREASKRQGLKLLAIELAFNQDPFELTKDDAEILIQVRSNSVLWQKERLLNIGLKHLPHDCDKVAWIDCDIIFKNNNWIKEASDLLEKYVAIQLFSFFVFLPEDFDTFSNNTDLKFLTRFDGFVKTVTKNYRILETTHIFTPGGAWAIRRSVIDKIGFYDKAILGSADDVVARGFYGNNSNIDREKFSEEMKQSQDDWVRKAHLLVKGSCFYLNNIALHCWHGEMQDRKYGDRYDLVKEYGFNPSKDLKLNKYGCWEWNSNKIIFQHKVKKYFLERREARQSRAFFSENA